MDEMTGYLADVRRYEEILARDPRSFCFAPLSDVYRRMGRLDEALDVAIRGCETHPSYIAGYMALGRACFEKGLNEEARQALEKVIAVIPENLLAHELLSQVCRRLGDASAAARSEAIVRSLKAEPDEPSVQVTTSPLETGREGEDIASGFTEPALASEDEIIDLAEEIIELAEEIPDDAEELAQLEDVEEEPEEVPIPAAEDLAPPICPLSTATIAELYLAQGFPDRALGIYRELLASDPFNEGLRKKVEQLSAMAEQDVSSGSDRAEAAEAHADSGSGFGPPAEAVVLATLEGWLENIRRRR